MEKEYKFLTAHFFKGSQKGQINSLWKKRENLERIEEYKKALAAGHVKLDQPLNRGQVKRMEMMGLTVPDALRPPKKEKPKVPRQPRDPNDIRLNHKQVARLQSLGVVVPAAMMPIRGPRKPKVVASPTTVPPTTPAPENPPQTPPTA